MTTLSAFTDDEQKLLIALPYQVGMNISEADGEGGEENDQLEMAALERILGLLPGLYNHAPLVKEILEATKEMRPEWESWKDGSFDVTRECTEAMTLLKSKSSEAEVKAYAKALLEIADTVARAAGELTGMLEVRQEPDGAFFKLLKKIMISTGMIKEDTSANISASEQAAINKIASVLHT